MRSFAPDFALISVRNDKTMNEKKCMGCGAVLQTVNPNGPGYVKNLSQDLCQSCFRLRHYRDFKRVKQEVDSAKTTEFIENFKGHIFWVVDIMHLNQSLHTGLIRALSGKNVVLLINKRDLLPNSVSDNKLKQSIMRILKEYNVTLQDLIFVSAKKRKSLEGILPYLLDAPVAFVGCINAGKSSLLNTLLKEDTLSVSPVSSTTAGIIKIENEHYEVYDTPGFIQESKLVDKFSDENLLQLAPSKPIKPTVIQIYEKQAIMIGNLGYIVVEPVKTINFISYLPIKVKRVKASRADANLELEHEFMIQDASYRKRVWPTKEERLDLEIFDIGFISIQGKLKTLETRMDKDVEIIIRKAII